MYRLLHILGVAMLMITTAQGRICYRDKICPPKSIVEKECPYGVVKDGCDPCWTCALGYRDVCGGLWSVGACAEGLECLYPPKGKYDIYGSGGICCRNTTLIGSPTAPPACETGAVKNPCSGEYECKKAHGEICGGPVHVDGACADNLTCYPPVVYAHSTCINPDEIPFPDYYQ